MTTAVADRSSAPLPNGQADELSHKQILEVMTGLLAALFTAMISSTIVSTALPTIMADLQGTQRQYTWVITASLLAMTISTPIMGKLSDLFNKKFLIQFSIVLFVSGSIAAGFSQEIWQMMAARAAQGVAMGGLMALTQSIMGTIIAPRQRGRYSGYMGAVMAVATVSGPLLGGVITDHLDWRWTFFVCVPLAVIALFLLQITLKLPTLPKRRVRLDFGGAFFLAVAAAAPMLWVTFAGKDYEWISWESAAFLGAFLLAAGIAVLIELRHPEPVVPIRVLSNSTTALMIIAGMAVGVAMFGSGTFLTQYFQLAGGHSPTRAGLMTIPMIISQLLSSVLAGQIVSRTGRWKPIMIIGSVLVVTGMGGLGFIDHTTPYWQFAIWMAIAGIGIGALVQNIVLAVQNTVDVKDIGASSATIAFFRSLGGAVGVSVLGAVLADQVETKTVDGIKTLPAQLQAVAARLFGNSGGNLDLGALPDPIENVVRDAYGDTFGTLFLIAAVVAVVAVLAILVVREVPLRTTVAMRKPAEAAGATSSTGATASSGADTAVRAESSADGSISPAAKRAASVSTDGSIRAEGNRPEPSPTSSNGAPVNRPEQAPGHREVNWDPTGLDDPSERLSVAALDVLTAARDQARDTEAAGKQTIDAVAARLDGLAEELDSAVGRFHQELRQLREQLVSEQQLAHRPAPDGVGGTELRQYEYNLLRDTQQTAERTITEAEQQRAELEMRIERLRSVERELAAKVSEKLRMAESDDNRG